MDRGKRASRLLVIATTTMLVTACSGSASPAPGTTSPTDAPAATAAATSAATDAATDAPAATAAATGLGCGLGTGVKATGEPIKIGAIATNQPGIDFTEIPKLAKAYFDCVNDNGGINGRPVEYILEEEQTDPQQVAALATKLLTDEGVVAMAGNTSLLDCTVNADLYKQSGINAVVAGVPPECFRTPVFAPTNFGPYYASIAAAQQLVADGAQKLVVVTANTPGGEFANSGATGYADMQGIESKSSMETVPITDANGLALRLVSDAGENGGVLLNFSPPELIKVFTAIQQQGLIDAVKWACVSCIDKSIADALDPAWNGKLRMISEFDVTDSQAADAALYRTVTEKYAPDQPLGNFGQMGFLIGKVVTSALLSLDPASIDRASVNEAILNMEPVESDMLCGPWYYGPGDIHVPNNSARVLAIQDHTYQTGDCVKIAAIPGSNLDAVQAVEASLGIGQ